MALTRAFKELVQKRIVSDPSFGDALLRDGIDTMLAVDVETGKAILHDYIKATVGFEKLGQVTGTPAKSLIRMLGPRGNSAQSLRHHRPLAEASRHRAARRHRTACRERP